MITAKPRLWIERVAIVRAHKPRLELIRDIPMLPGLNLVWATEQANSTLAPAESAGHGVGKTTFCLMLRSLLGDEGKAVKHMREQLAGTFMNGGVAAELHVHGQQFAVFRPFGEPGWAGENTRIEDLFERPRELSFAEFVDACEARLLGAMSIRNIPGTGQAIEWPSVLCWLARDQGSRLRHYFDWRSDDGTGLQRSRQDPPLLMRAVLGLVSNTESQAEKDLGGLASKISAAKEAVLQEERRVDSARAVIEGALRTWAGVSEPLAMVSDDLFGDSVRQQIDRTTARITQTIASRRTLAHDLDRENTDAAVKIATREGTLQRQELGLAALRAERNENADEAAKLRAQRDELLKLQRLAGDCEHGNIPFSKCTFIQEQITTVPMGRHRRKMEVEEERRALDAEIDQLERMLAPQRREIAAWRARVDAIAIDKQAIESEIEQCQKQLGGAESLARQLDQWTQDRSHQETEALSTARGLLAGLQSTQQRADDLLALERSMLHAHTEGLSRRFSTLAAEFGLQGRFVAADTERPFQLVDANGEAYTVLEIVLGDLACALAREQEANQHSGFVILDCPREADMSTQLYHQLLATLAAPGFNATQIILTTTTPPPVPLQDDERCVLRLNRDSEDGLLLKTRIAR